MNKEQMRRTIYGLASGTQARLFNLSKYDEIEAAVQRWVDWVDQQPVDKCWDTWHDCLQEYKNSAS